MAQEKRISTIVLTIAFRLSDKYKGYGIDIEDASGEAEHVLPVHAVFMVRTDCVIKLEYVNPDHKERIILMYL